MALQLRHHQQFRTCGGASSCSCTRIHKPAVKFGGLGGGNSRTTTPPSEFSSVTVELDSSSPLPLGWQKFLDLKSGAIYYKKDKQKGWKKTMSRSGKAPKLDLRLNLSPPRGNQEVESPRSWTPSPSPPPSPPGSCISSEHTTDMSSPEATSMILAGCPRCLMYVMLSEEDPKCPKCKSTVLLDFLHENNHAKKSRKD